jgi:hypothetical protein
MTYRVTALNGITRTSQTFGGRKLWELNFVLQDNTFVTAFQSFMSTIRGKLYPFFFKDVDANLTRYFKLDSDYQPLTGRRYNINDLETLKLKTYGTY